jgi:hypothetical protein
MFLHYFHRIMHVTHLARPESKWDDSNGLFHTYVRQKAARTSFTWLMTVVRYDLWRCVLVNHENS